MYKNVSEIFQTDFKQLQEDTECTRDWLWWQQPTFLLCLCEDGVLHEDLQLLVLGRQPLKEDTERGTCNCLRLVRMTTQSPTHNNRHSCNGSKSSYTVTVSGSHARWVVEQAVHSMRKVEQRPKIYLRDLLVPQRVATYRHPHRFPNQAS